jgi:FAD/FMN-containing dehydrogenase
MRVANVFHAGDGNLHPLVLYDNDVPGEAEKAEALAGDIVFTCLEHGGSLTGEHGIGEDKKKYMPKMFTTEDLDTMQLCGAPSTRTRSATPARSSRPRASAASGRGPSACTPSSRPAWRRTSDGDAHEERLAGGPAEHSRRGARPRGAAEDAVDGVAPSFVVEPGSTEEISELMKFANDQDLAVAPRGGGTTMSSATRRGSSTSS